jgi:hypothetical protein
MVGSARRLSTGRFCVEVVRLIELMVWWRGVVRYRAESFRLMDQPNSFAGFGCSVTILGFAPLLAVEKRVILAIVTRRDLTVPYSTDGFSEDFDEQNPDLAYWLGI